MGNHGLPDPASITIEHVKRMNATSWRLLALVVAGSEGVLHGACPDGLSEHALRPDSEDRERAAAIVEKCAGFIHAEVVDDARATLGREARPLVDIYRTVDDFMDVNRYMLPRLKDAAREALMSDAIGEKLRDVVKGASYTPEHVENMRNIVLAWDVLKIYRGDPDRALDEEEFLDLWNRTAEVSDA